jgi:hypothetical protein
VKAPNFGPFFSEGLAIIKTRPTKNMKRIKVVEKL